MASSRVGRPPKISRADIAEAALEIGLDRATVRNVAAHLGMSVPGLYHHVRTREELLALAAAHSLGALVLPPDRGQPLDEWLSAYCRFVYDALVAQPELIGQILAGTVNTTRQTQHLERFFEVLTARGHTVAGAYRAYELLMAAVTGAAAFAVGHAAAAASGHSPDVDIRRAAQALGPATVPLVSKLVRHRLPSTDPWEAVRVAVAHVTAPGMS